MNTYSTMRVDCLYVTRQTVQKTLDEGGEGSKRRSPNRGLGEVRFLGCGKVRK